MVRTGTSRLAVTLAAAAVALTALTAAAPAADAGVTGADHPARLASVSGSARIFYAFRPNDEIRFTVDAQAAPYTRGFPGTQIKDGLPTDARGTVHFSHRVVGSSEVHTADAAVDCLVTGDRVATVTAVITKSDVMPVGQRVGLSIYHGPGHGNDRLGFSWGVGNLDVDADGKPVQPVVGTCMAPAPFAPVVDGGFAVHPADLEVR
ncbi:hypothetical protein E6W39_13285 [Kitasatospora acidiphila]|uniref:Repetin n=1 Tax=Kitasatospora acidiphila TaxID=2567942 RepID=A0A540W200_9ACTN|nr:hypothetical protein [Kitasatospora acidiphila]TQF03050.1 hypothetical protein E6W39_13285 [Kitasatospora acidiphila]